MLPVSIIVPNYNNQKFIARCLQSLGDVADEAFEVLVFDDASTDGSVDVIESLNLPWVQIIRSPTNVGTARARHAAILRAKNDYICYLDGDDFLSPDAIRISYRQLVEYQLDMSPFNMVRTNEEATQETPFIDSPKGILDGASAFAMSLGAWNIHPMGVMKKAVYLRAAAGFHFDGYSDDELLTRRLFLASNRILGNEARYYYRQIKKPACLTRKLGQARTNVAVLGMAVENAAVIGDPGVLRAARNLALKSVLKAVRSSRRSGAEAASVIDLYFKTVSARVGWRMADWRYYWVRITLLLLILPLRLRSSGRRLQQAGY